MLFEDGEVHEAIPTAVLDALLKCAVDIRKVRFEPLCAACGVHVNFRV